MILSICRCVRCLAFSSKFSHLWVLYLNCASLQFTDMWCIHFAGVVERLSCIWYTKQRPPVEPTSHSPLRHAFYLAIPNSHTKTAIISKFVILFLSALPRNISILYFYIYQIGGTIFQFDRSCLVFPFAWIYSCVCHSCVQLNGLTCKISNQWKTHRTHDL